MQKLLFEVRTGEGGKNQQMKFAESLSVMILKKDNDNNAGE